LQSTGPVPLLPFSHRRRRRRRGAGRGRGRRGRGRRGARGAGRVIVGSATRPKRSSEAEVERGWARRQRAVLVRAGRHRASVREYQLADWSGAVHDALEARGQPPVHSLRRERCAKPLVQNCLRSPAQACEGQPTHRKDRACLQQGAHNLRLVVSTRVGQYRIATTARCVHIEWVFLVGSAGINQSQGKFVLSGFDGSDDCVS
jgi:hypothetical protein